MNAKLLALSASTTVQRRRSRGTDSMLQEGAGTGSTTTGILAEQKVDDDRDTRNAEQAAARDQSLCGRSSSEEEEETDSDGEDEEYTPHDSGTNGPFGTNLKASSSGRPRSASGRERQAHAKGSAISASESAPGSMTIEESRDHNFPKHDWAQDEIKRLRQVRVHGTQHPMSQADCTCARQMVAAQSLIRALVVFMRLPVRFAFNCMLQRHWTDLSGTSGLETQVLIGLISYVHKD